MIDESLEALIAPWQKTSAISNKLDGDKRRFLEVIYNQSKLTGDITTTLQDIATGTGFDEKNIGEVTNELGYMGCISYRGVLYRLTCKGYEVFEPERVVLSRLVISLDKMHKMGMKWVRLPAIAREVGLGEFSITAHYLNKLGERIVRLNKYDVGEKRCTDARLTYLGMRLATYLKA